MAFSWWRSPACSARSERGSGPDPSVRQGAVPRDQDSRPNNPEARASPSPSRATTRRRRSARWSPSSAPRCPRPRSWSSTTTRPTAPATIASGLGVRVEVPEQGKGHAVRAAFAPARRSRRGGPGRRRRHLSGRGGAAAGRAGPGRDGRHGRRRPPARAAARGHAPVRGLGNLLIRSAFRLLIGPGTGDLLSGYRAFSRRFLQAVDLRSEGFEIETELASEAVTRRLRWSRSRSPIAPGSPGPSASCGRSATAGGSWGRSSCKAFRRDPAPSDRDLPCWSWGCFSCPHRTGPRCGMSGLRLVGLGFVGLLIAIAWTARGVAHQTETRNAEKP